MTIHDSEKRLDEPSDDELFAQAIELPSQAEQREFLQSKCPGDFDRQHRLWELIESQHAIQTSKRGTILDRPSEAFQVLDSFQNHLGTMIGPFQLNELLGEGGMGLVYLAEQSHPIKRRVAIKIVKPGMDSRGLLARFEAERQTLACLDHPSITHIIEAGVADSGQPYFVMELAEGVPITQCCHQHRASLTERIELLVDVCDAIQHAHQRGIIHRDIKPNNLIASKTDAHYQVKVIDFGIAKGMSSSSTINPDATHYGEFLGTPLYMSPEQMLCDPNEVDIRTDVYSLGAVLYELLTGELPIGSIEHTNHRMIDLAMRFRDTEIVAPSRRVKESSECIKVCGYPEVTSPKELRALLEGELDWILLKALAKDKRERYQSVLDFRRDLTRFLEGKPVEAAGERSLYRARKFIYRHRALTSFAVTTALLCICFTITASWLFMEASRAEKIANSRLQEVLAMEKNLRSERDRAELAAKRSRTLAQAFVVAEVVDRTSRIFYKENAELFDEMERKNLDKLPQETSEVPVLNSMEDRALIMVLNSNLNSEESRMVVQGKLDWLADLLVDSDMKLKELIRRQREAELDAFSSFASTPEAVDGNELPYSPAFQFPSSAIMRFRELYLQEIQTAFDEQSKFVADAYDSLGLAQLDQQLLQEAKQNFEQANRIRANDPNQRLASIQSKLFLAHCLKKSSMNAESEALFTEVDGLLKTIEPSNETVMALLQLSQQMREN